MTLPPLELPPSPADLCVCGFYRIHHEAFVGRNEVYPLSGCLRFRNKR